MPGFNMISGIIMHCLSSWEKKNRTAIIRREGIQLPPFWCHIGAIKIKYQIIII
jgi:hypothetical protein